MPAFRVRLFGVGLPRTNLVRACTRAQRATPSLSVPRTIFRESLHPCTSPVGWASHRLQSRDLTMTRILFETGASHDYEYSDTKESYGFYDGSNLPAAPGCAWMGLHLFPIRRPRRSFQPRTISGTFDKTYAVSQKSEPIGQPLRLPYRPA